VCTPVNASPTSFRTQTHDSEPKWCATPFLCGSLIRYSMPVYPGASLITLSARYSIDCGMMRPICLAVFRLITSSNFVGCSTGRSAGLAPFRSQDSVHTAKRIDGAAAFFIAHVVWALSITRAVLEQSEIYDGR
jgi:hypothetical protein